MSISAWCFAHNARDNPSAEEISAMLVWEEDRTTDERSRRKLRATREPPRCASASPSPLAAAAPRLASQPVAPAAAAAAAPPTARRVKAADKRIINGQHRRQPAGAVQVQVGVGEVPRHLRQPLDAAGSQHVARHRDLEGSERPDRRRAPHRQAQPRLLRHRRFAGRQQHRARHLPPHHGARVPPVPAAPGVRGGDPHPRLSVHRRVARAWTRARSSTPTTRSRRSATRTSS